MPDLVRLNDRTILDARGPRNSLDPTRPYAFLVERERTSAGTIENVATVFITNKECPFRCVMCDLWRNATAGRLPEGLVAGQVARALNDLPFTPVVKLYNSGSFFDQQAIPKEDLPRISRLMNGRRTLIVESHPKLVDRRSLDFAESLGPTSLQIAMGLETVDPAVLPLLNKRMTLDDYARATELLLQHRVEVRTFILLRTPYQSEEQGVYWAMRSIDFAFSIGVECCVVIPVRVGNGIMERLEREGLFSSPPLRSLEAVVEYGLGLSQGRIFADLWDVARFFHCPVCDPKRAKRLRRMNLSQETCEPVHCKCEVEQ